MSVSEQLKKLGVVSKDEIKTKPLWDGPCSVTPNGGITFSLLSRFLQCRERFKSYVIDSLKPKDNWNHRIGYGNMWHLCEEHNGNPKAWDMALFSYTNSLCRLYPMQKEEIIKWYNVCKVQFPIYVAHWQKEQKREQYKTLLSEQVFDVPYTLPSGRIVRLRGKWDEILLKNGEVWLKENKTKGDIDTELIPRQLTFDCQTMMYLIAMYESRYDPILNNVIPKGSVLSGVIYNVIRRPLSGGKGTIVRHKATAKKQEETLDSYYGRLKSIIDGTGEDAPGPKHFFMRWEVNVGQKDIERFKIDCLNPVLENLCDWYDYYTHRLEIDRGTYKSVPYALHWRMPYGVSQLEEYGPSAYDRYLETGDTAGLEYVSTLFEELQ